MIDPLSLRAHYSRFLDRGRVLLTGHSHQAWPDVARDGLLEAFDDAAHLADDKWTRATEAADAVRDGVVERIGGRRDEIALAASVHELVARLLSALDWKRRRHLVSTDGEFHSLRRQLLRLREAGVDVTLVPARPVETLADRLAGAVRDDTAALLASTVLFETSTVVPGLARAAEVAQSAGAIVLLDAYHAFNVVPFRIETFARDPIYVTGGGYKYAQWGEGCCFLRVPPDCDLRPVYTGWFSDFAGLSAPQGEAIGYGRRPADRFAGATYDPSSHYRARAVIHFFREQGMTVDRLKARYDAQTGRIQAALASAGADVLTPAEPARRGGFVAVRVEGAARVVRELAERGVAVDSRADVLRIGPAPYVTDDEIDRAMAELRPLLKA